MKRVEAVLAGLESARRRLLAEIEGVHEPRFSTRPAPGRWSVGHVVEHLCRTDEALARGITAACAGKLRLERRPSDVLRRLFYLSGLYRIGAARTSAKLDPEESPGREPALARLAAIREQLREAIEAGEKRGMWSHSLRHPIFGPLSMAEMLDFVAYHEERHRRQIVRVKAALEKAGR